ncbi:MAG: O-antigen ligase family protein [Gammaproteobacteria bacterium]
MADLLLQFFYFARPLMFVNLPGRYFGLSVFEIFAIVLLGVLLAAYLVSKPAKHRGFDALDSMMLAFTIWACVVTFIQSDVSDWKWTFRWTLPLIIYMLLRRMVRTEKEYMRYLHRLLISFVVVIGANAIAIYVGYGFVVADWVTGVERHDGIFNDVHTMAHTVGFGLMLVVIYYGLLKASGAPRQVKRRRPALFVMVAVMVPLGIYCQIMGNVRTVLVGLVVFLGILLLMTNRRRFVMFAGALVVIWVTSTFVETIFWDVTGRVSTQGDRTDMAGSGRPWIWKHNLGLFADLPIEQKIMGIGVGNEIGVIGANGVITAEYRYRAWESHNDFLSALMELGIVGFLLLSAIFWLWFRTIMRLPMASRVLFMSLLGAVVVMNFLSNSYLSRFGLGQLLSMVMIGIHVLPMAQTGPIHLGNWRGLGQSVASGSGRG